MKKFFEKFNKKIDVGNNVIYVFIDASNLWQAQKAKGRFLDYEKTLKFIKENFNASFIKVFYYTAYPAEGTRNYSLDGKHKFFTFLKKGLGFEVRKKELRTGGDGYSDILNMENIWGKELRYRKEMESK